MTLVNIYAPNDESEAKRFFDKLSRKLRGKLPIILGDFNHVEHAIDRQPQRDMQTQVWESLAEMNRKLGLVDGWRRDNPGVHSFTWTALMMGPDGVKPRSRLDRILATLEMCRRTLKWEHLPSMGLSDHMIATAEIIDDLQPESGQTRWRMADEEINDPRVLNQVRDILAACQARMLRGEDPMATWLRSKDKIHNVFETIKRSKAKERSAGLKNLEGDLRKMKRRPDYHTNEQIRLNAEAVESRIEDIRMRMAEKAAETTRARYQALGETVSKYWFATGKLIQSANLMRSLKDKSGQRVHDTPGMLEIMAKHHEDLMAEPEMGPDRSGTIDDIINLASRTRISPSAEEILRDSYTKEEVKIAIKASHNGKAPGEDGFTYEFYKKWLELEENDKEGKTPSITSILQQVWNAPSKKKKAPEKYVQGLMALAYKKGDKEKPENYRPLTLLDTDYKLETKCLATRMGITLQEVIHKDQAGFVPGRDILDQIKLAQMVAEYCEITEQDGCLVALDQEKAYDRIGHKYLWQIMDAYGVPEEFTQRVKSLYENVTTQVTINKMVSRSIRIKRGVRQGDPMSCLLFDLAIEPLAEMFRRSNLKGIDIPGRATRLICKLFADDTQVYLSDRDDFGEAMEIAERWCLASMARFNAHKTEIMPMGSPRYRRKVAETRETSSRGSGTAFPPGTKIFETGESVRILGGRIGYNLDAEELWEPIIQKMERSADRWSRRHLTLQGRKLVASFLVLSRVQYTLMMNPPPKTVITRVNKILRTIVWKGKSKSTIRLEELYRPMEEGGLGLPDFEARSTAAKLMWIKKWRQEPAKRPDWTPFLDEVLKKTTKDAKKPWMTDILDQTWRERGGHKSPLSKDIRDMLKVAWTYNVRTDALRYAQLAKAQIPIWRSHHFLSTKSEENSKEARRLWKNHGIHTQGQLYMMSATPTNGCRDHQKCVEAAMKWKAKASAKSMSNETPVNRRTGLKDILDLTLRRKEKNQRERTREGEIILNPDVAHRDHLSLSTRVFGEPRNARDPSFRQTNLNLVPGTLIVYTDRLADKNGSANSNCGAGLWSEDLRLRGSFKIPGTPPTNNRGELAAAMIALQRAPLNQELLIKTDSMYVLNFLTEGHVKIEDLGWLGIPNQDLMTRTMYLLRRRTAPTLAQKVKAHSGHLGNEYADEAAKAALELDNYSELNVEVPEAWRLSGARLSTLSYHDMYKWIRALQDKGPSTKAPEIIEGIQDETELSTGLRPTAAAIWMGLKSPIIRKQVSDFLWQAIHGRTVCGPHFAHWGGEWTERQYCECGAIESLPHILLSCQQREWRKAVWEEYVSIRQQATATKTLQQEIPSYSEILGIGVRKSELKGATVHLEKILIAETAFVIWKLRNKQRIEEEVIHPNQARNALRSTLMDRAKTDFATAKLKDLPRRGKKNLKREAVATWDGLIDRSRGQLHWIPSDYG